MAKFHEPPELDDMVQIRAGLPVKPYNGTGGWSGSDTSKERAEWMVSSGELSKTQQGVIRHLSTAKAYGCTWKEIQLPDGNGGTMHHGSISGALSNLHKDGRISRLTSKRDGCLVYVLNEWVQGRELSAPKTYKKRRSVFRLEPVQDKLEKRDKIMALLISRRLDLPTDPIVYMQLADEIISLFDIHDS